GPWARGAGSLSSDELATADTTATEGMKRKRLPLLIFIASPLWLRCLRWQSLLYFDLNSAQGFAVLRRRDSNEAFEGSSEMALVAKARRQSNLDNRRFRRGKLVTGVFDSQLPHVISDCALVRLLKRLGQMDRMHADVMRQLRQCEALGEARVQKVSGLLEPPRRQVGAYSRIMGVMASGLPNHFEHQTFDHE